MATLRSVNTRFWEDPWVEELSPSEKLLFLYLLTCKYANLAGIFEITIRRISFETGLNNETIRNGLKRFAKDKKAFFVDENYMFLPNWLKNQNLNSNMKKGVIAIFSELPKDVKINVLGNGYQTVLKDYQTLRNTLLKYEVEVEREVEVEDEGNNSDENKFSREREILNFVYPYFDEKTINGLTEKDKEKWLNTIRLLHDKDGFDYDEIKETIIFGREDDFWKDNFLAIPPLRGKKGGDVTKFQKLNAKMKSNGRNNGKTSGKRKQLEEDYTKKDYSRGFYD